MIPQQKPIKHNKGFTAETLFNVISSAELLPQQTLKSLTWLQSFPVTAYLCVYFKSEVLLYALPNAVYRVVSKTFV